MQIIAENLSEEEIAGLKEMFKMIDTDNSGQITFEELKDGLRRFGANLTESEIYQLMQAVRIRVILRLYVVSFIILKAFVKPEEFYIISCCGNAGRC